MANITLSYQGKPPNGKAKESDGPTPPTEGLAGRSIFAIDGMASSEVRRSLDQSVRASATLADRLPAFAVTWRFARGISKNGSGKAVFTIAEAAARTGYSCNTFRQYLGRAERAGLFRSFKRSEDGTITAYPSALWRVCVIYGIQVSGLGAIFHVPINQLKSIKALATEATIVQLQQQSRDAMFLEQQQKQQAKKPKVPTADSILNSSACLNGSGHQRKRRYFYVDKDFGLFGGTQATAGQKLGRHRQTVHRRLSSLYRSKRGLQPLDRIQLAQEVPGGAKDWSEYAYELAMDGAFSDASDALRTFNHNGRAYRPGPCLYRSSVETLSAPKFRASINRAISRNTPHPWT